MRKRTKKLTMFDHELNAVAERMGIQADEREEHWRKERHLLNNLHHAGDARAIRRKCAECPKEPRANVRFRRWRDRQMGKMGAASKVRRIDPMTGEVMS